MQSAFDGFIDNIQRVWHLHGLHQAFQTSVTNAVDLSDILRAELVMAVSALDSYVHELTKLGMLECYSGNRTKTEAFNRFQIPLSLASTLMNSTVAIVAFEAEIRVRHSHLSFQHPDRIADAIRLFSPVSLWDEVAVAMGISARDLKNTLGLIVDRRNKIAHEADVDPSFPGQRWPIDSELVRGMVGKIEAVVIAIHKVCV